MFSGGLGCDGQKALKKAEEERVELDEQLADYDQCRDEVRSVRASPDLSPKGQGKLPGRRLSVALVWAWRVCRIATCARSWARWTRRCRS
jgi:hypothetical protein